MTTFSERRVNALARESLSGYVLKKDSPSCGLSRVKVYPSEAPDAAPDRAGQGLFAAALTRAFPHLPIEEEGRLTTRTSEKASSNGCSPTTGCRACGRRAGRCGRSSPFTPPTRCRCSRTRAWIPAPRPTGGDREGAPSRRAAPALRSRLHDRAREARHAGRHVNVMTHMLGHFSDRLVPVARRSSSASSKTTGAAGAVDRAADAGSPLRANVEGGIPPRPDLSRSTPQRADAAEPRLRPNDSRGRLRDERGEGGRGVPSANSSHNRPAAWVYDGSETRRPRASARGARVSVPTAADARRPPLACHHRQILVEVGGDPRTGAPRRALDNQWCFRRSRRPAPRGGPPDAPAGNRQRGRAGGRRRASPTGQRLRPAPDSRARRRRRRPAGDARPVRRSRASRRSSAAADRERPTRAAAEPEATRARDRGTADARGSFLVGISAGTSGKSAWSPCVSTSGRLPSDGRPCARGARSPVARSAGRQPAGPSGK